MYPPASSPFFQFYKKIGQKFVGMPPNELENGLGAEFKQARGRQIV